MQLRKGKKERDSEWQQPKERERKRYEEYVGRGALKKKNEEKLREGRENARSITESQKHKI